MAGGWRICAFALAAMAVAGCTARRPASLGEPVGVEQPGGTVSQLIAQGSQLPTSATESFTTSRDDETKLLVHVVRGAGKSADKLKTDSWWQVEGVSGGKAGEAKVTVTFELDAQAQLAVSAREDDRRLAVKKAAEPGGKVALAPLTEPDDSDDAADDELE
jgi:molecular chaperone DnaK (HSP70)